MVTGTALAGPGGVHTSGFALVSREERSDTKKLLSAAAGTPFAALGQLVCPGTWTFTNAVRGSCPIIY